MINLVQLEEQNKQLLEKFDSSRKEWNSKIKSVIELLNDITEYTKIEVLRLSYRHIAVDMISDLNVLIYRKRSEYDTFYKQLYINYKTNYSLKLTQIETDKFIVSDLCELQRQISLIENHIYYFREMIKTIDNIAFAIKNKISLIEETIK